MDKKSNLAYMMLSMVMLSVLLPHLMSCGKYFDGNTNTNTDTLGINPKDTAKITDKSISLNTLINNGTYRDYHKSSSPAGYPTGDSYQNIVVDDTLAKYEFWASSRFGDTYSYKMYKPVLIRDSIILLKFQDSSLNKDKDTVNNDQDTVAELITRADEALLSMIHLIVYRGNSGDLYGVWQKLNNPPEPDTQYFSIDKDSISFFHLEVKFKYRFLGDTLIYETQYGEFKKILRYGNGHLFLGEISPQNYLKVK